MRKVITTLVFGLMFACLQPIPTSIADIQPSNFDAIQWKMDYAKTYDQHPKEVQALVENLIAMREKWHLEDKGPADLTETVTIAWCYADATFTVSDVVSLIGAESRMKRKAVSRRGARGLTQIMMKEWGRPVLPYLTNPYDKRQAIRATVDILHKKKVSYHGKKLTKWVAIQRYNGVGQESRDYVRTIRNFKKDLLKKS